MRMADIVTVKSTSSRDTVMKTVTYEALAVTRGGENYSCFQKGSRNVLFFLLFDAFRRLNVAERKWVNPTHLVYLFLRS